jgi:hypothetical protein
MVSKVIEHPFDLCKVRLQSQVLDATARFKGPLDCLSQTWRNEGIRGLYRVSVVVGTNSCICAHICCICDRVCHRPCLVPWQRMPVCSSHTASSKRSSSASALLLLASSRSHNSLWPPQAPVGSPAPYCEPTSLVLSSRQVELT